MFKFDIKVWKVSISKTDLRDLSKANSQREYKCFYVQTDLGMNGSPKSSKHTNPFKIK